MPEPNRIVIDRVDWKSVLPVLRLASAFKHALQPGKLFIALLAVVIIHLSGIGLGALFEAASSAGDDGHSDERSVMRAVGHEGENPYDQFLSQQVRAFQKLSYAALSLDHGFDSDSGVSDQLANLVVLHPMMLFERDPFFALVFSGMVLLVLSVSTGILCRMGASQVCANRVTPMAQAVCHVRRRWLWYVLTPLMPLLLIGVLALLLYLSGLVFFNVPWLDAVGSLGFGVMLLMGVLIAGVLLLLALAFVLMPPALSVEGSEGFDAVSRSFNYILFRPWQFAAYLFSAALYLGVVYVLLTVVAGLGLGATHYFVNAGAIGESSFQQIINASYDMGEASSDANIQVSGWIIGRWIDLMYLIVVAVLFSTICCLQTQIYVLMRRSADGTPMDQCDGGEEPDLWAEAPASEQAGSTDDTAGAEG